MKCHLSQRQIDGYNRYCQLIQWGRKYPIRFMQYVLGIDLLDYQKYVMSQMWVTPNVVICASRNSGKAVDVNTLVKTPKGDKKIIDLDIGDSVIGQNGRVANITHQSEIFFNHNCYKLIFEDGEEIIADENHLWLIKEKGKNFLITKRTVDMINNYVYIRKDEKGKEYKFRVPVNQPIDYSEKDFVIHPYVLGVWLGDGESRGTRITSHVDDVKEMQQYLEACGYNTKINYDKKRKNLASINVGYSNYSTNPFLNGLKELDLLKNKHIPKEYLFGSIKQRYELLQGLMDTDGSCNKNTGECEFTQKDLNIIKDIEILLSSLGIKYTTDERYTTCKGKRFKSYRIRFFTDKRRTCFKLQRKHNRLKNELNNRMNYKSIISIEKVKTVPTKCISVDNDNHTYLCGNRNTVTHNSTISAPYIMSKSLLIPNFQSYIISGNASQAQETFL